MKYFFTFMFLIFSWHIQAQMSGNQVYKSRSFYDGNVTHQQVSNYQSTDSTLMINVNVLLNQQADKYMITLGVSEEAETPKKSLENINRRIESFIKRLAVFGVQKEEVFIDFISLTKIYDFEISNNQNIATQKIKGFEIKKNIIISINEYSKIEKIITEAADYQIYDLIKVDYINDNIEKIQQELLNEAYVIFERKKATYLSKFNREILGSPIANDNFYYVFPKSQYQNYSAFESADVDVIRGNNTTENYVKKLERKSKTFYYEGVDYSGFDKVINHANPTVGIQYIFNLSVKYKLKK